MPNVAAIRQGLADAVSTIPNIGQVSPYILSNATPPFAHVFPDETNYDKTFTRGVDDWVFTVQVFVSTSTDRGAQERLDLMLAPSGENSVKAAIQADRTLGGAVISAQVVRCSGYATYERADGSVWLGADWAVQVMATGT